MSLSRTPGGAIWPVWGRTIPFVFFFAAGAAGPGPLRELKLALRLRCSARSYTFAGQPCYGPVVTFACFTCRARFSGRIARSVGDSSPREKGRGRVADADVVHGFLLFRTSSVSAGTRRWEQLAHDSSGLSGVKDSFLDLGEGTGWANPRTAHLPCQARHNVSALFLQKQPNANHMSWDLVTSTQFGRSVRCRFSLRTPLRPRGLCGFRACFLTKLLSFASFATSRFLLLLPDPLEFCGSSRSVSP